ncbi:MAG: 30S ribosomal protein S3ae [Candidatus Diapherotrites archaeon]|nr:30S ribosomal protein S3ae [Candidatus Diapherotrites archaeon]
MAKTKKRKSVDAWKTKKWFTIHAPKSFDEKVIGETIANEPSSVVGRTVKATMRDVTGNIQQQAIEVNFRVDDVKGTRASTVVTGHKVQRGFVGRQIKRMRTLIPVIFPVRTKDGVVVQTTLVGYARKGTRVKQQKAIRAGLKAYMEKHAAETNFNKFIQEIIFGKLAAEAFKEVKNIYPTLRVQVIKTRVVEDAGQRAEESMEKEEQSLKEELLKETSEKQPETVEEAAEQ